MSKEWPWWRIAGLLIAAWLIFGGAKGCDLDWIPGTTKATAATYVYEKDAGGVPSFVGAALDKLNRQEPPIRATTFEEDTTDSTGETPAQYQVAVKAARDAGLPALVIQAGERVLRVVKDPKTEADFAAAVYRGPF